MSKNTELSEDLQNSLDDVYKTILGLPSQNKEALKAKIISICETPFLAATYEDIRQFALKTISEEIADLPDDHKKRLLESIVELKNIIIDEESIKGIPLMGNRHHTQPPVLKGEDSVRNNIPLKIGQWQFSSKYATVKSVTPSPMKLDEATAKIPETPQNKPTTAANDLKNHQAFEVPAAQNVEHNKILTLTKGEEGLQRIEGRLDQNKIAKAPTPLEGAKKRMDQELASLTQEQQEAYLNYAYHKRLVFMREKLRNENDLFNLYLIWRQAKEQNDGQLNQALQEQLKNVLGLNIVTEVSFTISKNVYLKAQWYDKNGDKQELPVCKVSEDGLRRIDYDRSYTRKKG